VDFRHPSRTNSFKLRASCRTQNKITPSQLLRRGIEYHGVERQIAVAHRVRILQEFCAMQQKIRIRA
jgi:hypothetical protein